MKRKVLNGYWIVYVPEHDGCMRGGAYDGWEYEHRYLIEVNLGRILGKDEIVHHVDHDRLNNSLDNLQLMTRSSHASLHETERGHGIKHHCVDCGKLISYKSTRCTQCNNHLRYGAHRPSREEMKRLIEKYNNTQIAAKYGVSDKAVAKWRKKYGLPSWNGQHGKHSGIKIIQSDAG